MEVSGQLNASAGLLLVNESPERIEWGAGWYPDPIWSRIEERSSPTQSGIEPSLSST